MGIRCGSDLPPFVTQPNSHSARITHSLILLVAPLAQNTEEDPTTELREEGTKRALGGIINA